MKSLAPVVLLVLATLAGRPLAALQEAPLVVDDERVKAPKRLKLVRPEYPAEARAQGIRGIVILALTIDTEGRVAEVAVVRSIPGLDEAAVSAARQWLYEPPRVDGKPASVQLTVPITFALELPALTRQAGIPELRSGASPAYPSSGQGRRGEAVADVTLDREGRVAQAEILSGESPWIEALLQAVRTWSFVPEASEATLSFRVEAEFEPAGRGDPGRVSLNLTGLRRSESMAAAFAEPGEAAAPVAPAASEPPAASESPTPEPAAEQARPTPEAPGGAAAVPAESRPAATAPTPEPSAAPAETSAAPSVPESTAPPAEGQPAAPPPSQATPPPTAADTATAPEEAGPEPPAGEAPISTPASEVLTAPPTPPPPPLEPGVSSIRDVTLEAGIPDLFSGRRPVPPPLARLQGIEGAVSVRFSIDGAGDTLIQTVEGPEALQLAARETVDSWRFRRTVSRERLFGVAELIYLTDTASARVRLAE